MSEKNHVIDTELNKEDSVFAENKLLKLVLIVFAILGYLIYSKVSKLEDGYRAVITFPGSAEDMEVTGTRVSDRYLMMACEFFASNYFSATPATVDQDYSAILRFVHPTQFGVMQERLDKEAKKLKDFKTTSIYGDIDWTRGFKTESYRGNKKYPGGISIKTVRFDVARSIYVGAATEAAGIENKTMAIDYTIENGRFWILDLSLEEKRAAL